MTIVHYEPEEFVRNLYISRKSVSAHAIILEEHIGALVYYFLHDGCAFYMDRVEVSHLKKQELSKISFQALHAQVYRKFALDVSVCFG